MMRLAELPNSVPEEKPVLMLRRHWIDVLRMFLFTFMLLIVPIGTLIFFGVTGSHVFSSPLWGPMASVLFMSYFFIVFILTLTEITDYWLDVWIVTTERVINTEQLGLFHRIVSELHLRQIQDITSEMQGLLETFLTFGDVYIQTAAAKVRFQFKNIDNPDQVKIKIGEMVEICKTSHGHREQPAEEQLVA
jgi:membrane protein YdbS with pleckstrin-like domain